MDDSPPGSSVHGDSPGKNNEVGCHASPPGESSQPRDQTQVSSIADGFFTSWATREAQRILLEIKISLSYIFAKTLAHIFCGILWCTIKTYSTWHLLSAYYVPDLVVSTLGGLFHKLFSNNPIAIIIVQFYTEITDAEKLKQDNK